MSQRRSYLPVVLATIMILLSLGLIGVWWWFVGAYNALPSTPSTANSNTTSNTNSASNTNTSAVTTPGTIIADAFVNLGKTLVIDSSFTAKNLPADVFAGQVGDAYVADDYAFLIIHERNMNTPVLPVDQAVTWAGVLVSNDRGTTWQKWYTIVDPTVDGAKLAHNVVGIFTLDKKMYLDVADARGAGSGEGNMRRIVSSDAGASWADGACSYMSMETYYKPTVADRQGVTVDGLTPGTNCAYTVTTATASAGATKNWKTYVAQDHVYSFRYPSGLRYLSPEGLANLGSLESDAAPAAYQNMLVGDADTNLILTIDAFPKAVATPAYTANALQQAKADSSSYYTKGSETINGVVYDRYQAVGQGYNYAGAIYTTERSNYWFFVQLNNQSADRFTLAQQIFATLTIPDSVATKDWKTYTNTSEGFSVRYPTEWTAVESASNLADSLRSIVTFYSPQFQSKLNLAGEISIIRFANADNLSLAAYWNLVNDLGVTATPVPTTVNGFEAQRLDRLSNSSRFPSPRTDVHIKADGKIFGFIIQNVNGNLESQIDTFDLIVSTFQFAKETATKDWKTYTNTAHSYSFQYPEDWILGDSPTTVIPSTIADDIVFDAPDDRMFRFGVRVVTVSGCTALKTCTEVNRLSFGTGEQTTGLTDTTIGGQAALKETITRPTTGNWKYYVHYVLKGNNFYRFYTMALATDDSVTKPTFDQILSTVTFTE